jgi:hypothetical protein
VTATCSSAIRSSSCSSALVYDLRAAFVAIFVADLFKLLDDDCAELLVAAQDSLVLIDARTDFSEFLEQLIDRELGQAVELQLEDGVDLAKRESLFFVDELFPAQVDDDLTALGPGVEVFASVDAGV